MPRLSKIGAAALAAFGWTGLQTVNASYLVVAGGGGGGKRIGAGGGAGGYRTGTTTLNPTLSYTVTVGAGGAGSGVYSSIGTNGSDSTFSTVTSTGGGGGDSSNPTKGGGSGGSGGGSSDNGTAGSGNTPSTSPSQGNNGGVGSGSAPSYGAGGGGGASAVGGSGTSTVAGNGGAGTASSISGSSVTYAGGGGGGSNGGTAGTGGSGGGGAGTTSDSTATAGTANLGGGGGGCGGFSNSSGTTFGGQGGSGVVIISYVGAQQFGGGVVTSVGGNTIHTFTTSGTLSPLNRLTANFLVVAGGGGGGAYNGGGGGAGGLRSSVTNTGGGGSLESSLTIDTNSTYLVTVGAGGSGQISSTQSVAGSNSSFLSITSVGGGRGGGYTGSFYSASTGGSGGGAPYAAGGPGAAGTTNQGFAGGNGDGSVNSGGGGGAGAVGGNATASVGGNGGVGVAVAISGTSTFYAGGGGGAGYPGGGGAAGTGGNGGGGNGGANSSGTAGTANRGGGGGGSQDTNNPPNNPGGNGGSGVVIISYAGSTPQMAGGTVTVAGGNVIHTFTSSGYLSPITNLNNSLRFRQSASAYLSRTPTVSGNQQRFTISFWMKYSALTSDNILLSFGTSTTFLLQFVDGGRQLYVGTQQIGVGNPWGGSIPPLIRDPASWYHFVIAIDTTQATAANRVLMYINGVAYTFSGTAPTQNYNAIQNPTTTWRIGSRVDGVQYTDGYMAEFNYIDGQQLTANSFGAFNGQGVWQPVRYGGSYGTNGFYLPFTGSSNSTFAGSFNGSNQFLSVAQNAAFSFSTGDFTVETWVYANSWNSVNPIIALGDGSVGGGSPVYSGWVMRYDNSSDGLIWYRNDNTVGETSIRSYATLSATRWNHIAISRSSGILRMFINGIQVYSAANTTNYDAVNSNTLKIGGNWVIGGGVITWVNGYISNTRIVKGTGLYTGNFTPSTSALTNISGTSLLTLQNSTIIDNSSNAFTITNNNTVTTSTQYPFVVTAFTDQSPNGNNWTPNNISGLNGSTYDFMRDVPTNTSATVANYATLNPLDTGGTAPSSANLELIAGAAERGVRSTFAIPTTGLYYAEAVVGTNQSGATDIAFGFVARTTNLSANPSGISNGWLCYATATTNITRNGTSTLAGAGTALVSGDVLQLAIDLANNKGWLGKNNTWFNGTTGTDGNPSTGANPTFTFSSPPELFVLAHCYSSTINVNFGQRPFTYTPPSGFVALNTFNLPTPTIGATPATTANKYMNIVLYTGDGVQDKTISGVGFQPDFVWIKNRGAAGSNVLYNAVTGGTKQLFSNLTDAEQTNNDITNGFSSDGFIVGDNVTGTGSTNQNTNTYVAWNWNAGGSTVTNTSGSITSQVRANTTAGFSVVTYTGNGTTSTVGHGLSVAPSMIIVKRRDAGSSGWSVYFTTLAAGNVLSLQSTNAASSSPNRFTTTLPTSTVFSIGTDSDLNASGGTYVAYCFAQVAGYSAFGSYTGNGSSDGPFVFTGFRPKFILIRRSDAAGGWKIYNTSGLNYNPINTSLETNDSGAEATSTNFNSDWLSNGFKLRTTYADFNTSGGTYIYMSFAESPFKYANAR